MVSVIDQCKVHGRQDGIAGRSSGIVLPNYWGLK